MTKKIVVVGAGFAGLKATKTLSKTLKTEAEITLIDRHSYHTMMTQLHEAAAGRVPITNVQYDLKRIFGHRKNVHVVTDTIVKHDKAAKKVVTEHGEYPYDYVVVAMGGEPNDFGVPGVKEYGYTLWSMEDAMKIKRHLEESVQRASTEYDPEKRKALLNFSVAGSGFTGIEMVGELIEWRDVVSREWKLDPKEFTLNVIEMMPGIMNVLDRKLADKAWKYLEKKGVNILVNHAISEVTPTTVKVNVGGKDEEKVAKEIPTNTLIWTTGVQGNTQASVFELEESQRGHRLQANEYMEAVGYEKDGIYVAGDVSFYIDPSMNNTPNRQVVEGAEQTGRTAALNIIAAIEGGEKTKFEGHYKGTMVSIGGRYGVAHIFDKIRLTSIFAMAAKNLTYLLYTLQIGSLWYFFTYLKNEIFRTPNGRNLLRGHASRLGNVLWSFPMRLFYGWIWISDAWPKLFGNATQSWMGSTLKIPTFLKSSGGWIPDPKTVADAAAGASTQAASSTSAVSVTDALKALGITNNASTSLHYEYGTIPASVTKGVPGWMQPMMKIFVPNYDTALFAQKFMSVFELLLGLAIVFGVFSFLANAATVGLTLMFASTGMLTWATLWYIPMAIALMNGSGRAFGLDFWIQPWIQKHFFRAWYGRTSSIYK